MIQEHLPPLALRTAIELFDDDAHGEPRALADGFRPSIWLGETAPTGDPAFHSVVVSVPDEPVQPGEAREISLIPLALETWPLLKRGTKFDLFDGADRIGRGKFLSTPADQDSWPQLRRALTHAFEDWIVDRFDTQPTRSDFATDGPDFWVSFADSSDEVEHRLVVKAVPRAPKPADVKSAARLLTSTGATTVLLLAIEAPGAATLRAIYALGTSAPANGRSVPKVRVVTTRDLGSEAFELFPRKAELTSVLAAAA